jgi:predicted methyltransferase
MTFALEGGAMALFQLRAFRGPFVLAAGLFQAALASAGAAAQTTLDLAGLGRPADEVARDATSKPLTLYEFFDIGPGDVVADLFAGSGYNTAILTHLVGDGGVVFSQDGRQGRVAERLKSGDLKGRSNIVVFKSVEDLPADSLDVVLTVRNYHDVPEGDVGGWLRGISRALKPGGVFAVVDVRTKPGFQGRGGDLHRIAEDLVVKEVTGAGFTLEKRSDMLANSQDTYESAEFENREGTDRMVLKFRKPAAGQANSNANE